MSRTIQLTLLVATIVTCSAIAASQDIGSGLPFNRPIAFTKNVGQWDSQVLYRADCSGVTVWLTMQGTVYQFLRTTDTLAEPVADKFVAKSHRRDFNPSNRTEQFIVKVNFVGASSSFDVVGNGLLDFRSNFFIGNDSTRWRTDVPNFKSVTIHDIYDDVDLCYYATSDGNLEYDFVLGQRADYNQIQIGYEGANSLTVNQSGDLEIETYCQTITECSPRIYREIDGKRKPVEGGFIVLENGNISFKIEELIDSASIVTIDPTIVFSTYIGGSQLEEVNAIAVDATGACYITGRTRSADFPNLEPLQSFAGPADAFVTKIGSSGDNIVYSTFLGGSAHGPFSSGEYSSGIAVDNAGRAYVCGDTDALDFPRVNSFLPINSPNSAFIARLSPTGNGLEYSSYVAGGSSATDIAVDSLENAYLVGVVYSNDFPVVGAFQPIPGGSSDGFLLKLDSFGAGPVFSTYFGGDDRDGISGVAVTRSGCPVVAGWTSSTNFPLKKNLFSIVDSFNSDHGFVAKFSPDGDSLIYSTILGGRNGAETVYQVAVDDEACAYAVGTTSSVSFPVKNAFLPFHSGANGFLTKISPEGDSLIFSTYISGSAYDETFDIAIVGGRAVVAGETSSSNFPLKDAYQSTLRRQDGFVMKFSLAGDSLLYSTLLGGSGEERIYGVAGNASGEVYVAGVTYSNNFPTLNPFQYVQGNSDGYVTKLKDEFHCGEIDANAGTSLTDAVLLITYIFAGGSQPNPIVAADVDCNGMVNISDAVFLIQFVFSGGPAPCASCP